MSRYQKGQTNLDFTEARDSEWQWYHALIDVLHHWHDAVDKGQSIRAVFVDFAKAFDHDDHNILVTKFLRFGLSDAVLCWMCYFLRHRTQRVKIGGVLSDWLPISAGMPQGRFPRL